MKRGRRLGTAVLVLAGVAAQVALAQAGDPATKAARMAAESAEFRLKTWAPLPMHWDKAVITVRDGSRPGTWIMQPHTPAWDAAPQAHGGAAGPRFGAMPGALPPPCGDIHLRHQIIYHLTPWRRLYQPRIHGHPALLQHWCHATGQWRTVGTHPSVW